MDDQTGDVSDLALLIPLGDSATPHDDQGHYEHIEAHENDHCQGQHRIYVGSACVNVGKPRLDRSVRHLDCQEREDTRPQEKGTGHKDARFGAVKFELADCWPISVVRVVVTTKLEGLPEPESEQKGHEI